MKVIDRIAGSSWAMEEWAIENVLAIAAREHEVTPQALEAYRAKTLERSERALVRDGVAILNVEGPLFKGANLMVELSGATSYQILRRDLQAALDDGSVRAIMLNVDSPGGEVRGANELATAIRDARGKKPIVAYVSDLAASAAYWIASAADKIVIGTGAELGSIGVRAALTDTSGRDAARGLKTVEFVSSQSPYKSADLNSEDGRARIQARVDALADVFVDTVAANRDATRAFVLERFGKGDMLIGKAAIDAGMADEFGTFEGTLAALARTSPVSDHLQGDHLVSTHLSPQHAGMTAHQIESCLAAGRAERNRCLAIIQMTPAGLGDLARDAMQSGKSPQDYAAAIAEKKAAMAALVDSQVSAILRAGS